MERPFVVVEWNHGTDDIVTGYTHYDETVKHLMERASEMQKLGTHCIISTTMIDWQHIAPSFTWDSKFLSIAGQFGIYIRSYL